MVVMLYTHIYTHLREKLVNLVATEAQYHLESLGGPADLGVVYLQSNNATGGRFA